MSERRVAVTGSSGLIGSAVVERLTAEGLTPVRVVRSRPAPPGAAFWDPASGEIEADALEGLEAVIHLAGLGIAEGRWTEERKGRIRSSRVGGTGLLARTLARRERPPGALLCASAVGYYGDRGDEPLDETSPPGTGFLPDMCREWEAAADPARQAGIRVVHLRTGIVLSPAGGALARMLPAFRLGLGATLGDGSQYLSWVSRRDTVAAYLHLLHRDDLEGPFNVTAPAPVRNREFTRTLGRVLGRPACLRVPAGPLRLLVGELAESLLGGARVLPARLRANAFEFGDPELEGALRRLLA